MCQTSTSVRIQCPGSVNNSLSGDFHYASTAVVVQRPVMCTILAELRTSELVYHHR